MYLGRNMGCKKIFLLFVLRWCWWHSTPIYPQLKWRDRILQVNCMDAFFFQCINLKTTMLCFQIKNVLIFFWSISFPNKFIQCPTDDMPFFMKFIHISCIPGGSAKNFEQSQISGLGTPECHRAAGHNSNLWPALQDYSQANLFSWFFLLHAGIMTSVRKDSESTTSSPHHSTTSSISKPEKEIFTTWQVRAWSVLNAIIWIIQ